MQHKDRRVGSGLVDFFQSWHAPLGELELRPPADHAHPLGRRRALCLLLQHTHGVGKRRHAIPTQLHIEVETTADYVEMAIIQARNDRAALQVDAAGRVRRKAHDFIAGAGRDNAPTGNRY